MRTYLKNAASPEVRRICRERPQPQQRSTTQKSQNEKGSERHRELTILSQHRSCARGRKLMQTSKGYAEWVGGHGEGTGGTMGMASALCRRKVESLESGLPELCAEKREKSDSSLYKRIPRWFGRTVLCELPPSVTNVDVITKLQYS